MYYPRQLAESVDPSCYEEDRLDTIGEFGRYKKQEWSFGVSRELMKKTGEVSTAMDSPGPGSYPFTSHHLSLFGSTSRISSMGKKLKLKENAEIRRSMKLPGPGSYELPSVVGKRAKQSRVKNDPIFSFGRENVRFKVPT